MSDEQSAPVHCAVVKMPSHQRQINMAVFSVLSIALISTGFTAVLASRPVVEADIIAEPMEPPAPIVRWTATVKESAEGITKTWTMHCDGDSGKDNLALWCIADTQDANWSSLSIFTHGPDITVNVNETLLMTASADEERMQLTTGDLVSTFRRTNLGTLPMPTNLIPSGPGLSMISGNRIAFDGNFPQDRRGTHTMSFRIQHDDSAIDVRYGIGTLDPDGRRVVLKERTGTISFRPLP